VEVKLKKLLTISVAVPEIYKGLPKGLMGNANSDPADDFTYPNGTVLPTSATEREIFSYGQTCKFVELFFKNQNCKQLILNLFC
jgi:hypothetical protein